MFERYTESARRVIFFARYEAAASGSPSIDGAHLLLGLLREGDGAITPVLERAGLSYRALQGERQGGAGEGGPVSTSVDIPLTQEVRRALEYASDEADRLHALHIGNEHLLLGLLREPEGKAAAVLARHGLSLEDMREELRLASPPSASPSPSPLPAGFPGLARFLAELDARRAGYHVGPFHGEGVRVEVSAAGAKWAVTFFADRVTVETFSSAGTIQDGAGLAELLDHLRRPR